MLKIGSTVRTRSLLLFGPLGAILIGLPIITTSLWVPAGEHQSQPTRIVGASVGVLVVALFIRVSLLGVRIEKDGVVVRNLLSRRVLRWSEIREFTLGPWLWSPLQGHVELRDGKRVVINSIYSGHPYFRGSVGRTQLTIDELNRMLRSRGQPARS